MDRLDGRINMRSIRRIHYVRLFPLIARYLDEWDVSDLKWIPLPTFLVLLNEGLVPIFEALSTDPSVSDLEHTLGFYHSGWDEGLQNVVGLQINRFESNIWALLVQLFGNEGAIDILCFVMNQNTYDSEDSWSAKVSMKPIIGEFQEFFFDIFKFSYVFDDVFKWIEFLVSLAGVFTFPHVSAQA